MHPTQRKLMKRIILFLSLQFPITYPAIAGQDIDLVANVKNSTCKSGISNQGNIDLGVVGVGYFSDNVTPESYQPGGKEFTVTVSDCALQGTGDVNRPGFPGEYFICELRLPDHYFRWKHNKLFLLLPEEYGPAFPAIVDCYTSPPT